MVVVKGFRKANVPEFLIVCQFDRCSAASVGRGCSAVERYVGCRLLRRGHAITFHARKRYSDAIPGINRSVRVPSVPYHYESVTCTWCQIHGSSKGYDLCLEWLKTRWSGHEVKRTETKRTEPKHTSIHSSFFLQK